MNSLKDVIAGRLIELSEIFEKVTFKHVFVGGSVMPFLFDPDAPVVARPTRDVDITVDVFSYAESQQLENELRRLGFENSFEAATAWIYKGYPVDVVPAGETLGRKLSPWFEEALVSSMSMQVRPNTYVSIIHPAVALAAKLYAFKNRGSGDLYASSDLEDVVALLIGRNTLVEEVLAYPNPKLKNFVSESLGMLMQHPDFGSAIEGHLGPSEAEQLRMPMLIKRLTMLRDVS